MKFAAFGRTQWLMNSIHSCLKRGHELVAIASAPASPEYKVTEKDFKQLAKKMKVPYIESSAFNPARVAEVVRKSKAGVAISVNWPILINRSIIDLFPQGIVNAHSGDLPRFRGNACPNWAILSGEERVVLSLHQMVADLDAGPIYLQRSFPLNDRTYISEVYRFLDENIPTMFADVLDGISKGSLLPRAQPADPSKSLRCLPRLPIDNEINWRLPSNDLDRLVRASAEPFSGAYTFLDGRKLFVWRAHAKKYPHSYLGTPGQVVDRWKATGEVSVFTNTGLLILEDVQLAGGRRQKAADVITSTRKRLGLNLSEEILSLRSRVEKLEAKLKGRR